MTDKQKRFAQEYMVDFNASKAAIRSGYAEKSARISGSKCMRNTNIKQKIADLQAKLRIKTGYTIEQAITELDEQITILKPIAATGNIAAMNSLNGFLREKNDITGHHKQTITNKTTEPAGAISPELQKDIDAAFAREKIRAANAG